MPHIILEYPEQLAVEVSIMDLLQVLHRTVAGCGLFAEGHIKTRAYAFAEFTHAGGSEPYLHIQARIKAGRSVENKKRLSEAMLTGLRALHLPVAVVTVEIVDMDGESYGKIASAS